MSDIKEFIGSTYSAKEIGSVIMAHRLDNERYEALSLYMSNNMFGVIAKRGSMNDVFGGAGAYPLFIDNNKAIGRICTCWFFQDGDKFTPNGAYILPVKEVIRLLFNTSYRALKVNNLMRVSATIGDITMTVTNEEVDFYSDHFDYISYMFDESEGIRVFLENMVNAIDSFMEEYEMIYKEPRFRDEAVRFKSKIE